MSVVNRDVNQLRNVKLPVIFELDRKWMGVIEILMRWETATWQSYIGRVM